MFTFICDKQAFVKYIIESHCKTQQIFRSLLSDIKSGCSRPVRYSSVKQKVIESFKELTHVRYFEFLFFHDIYNNLFWKYICTLFVRMRVTVIVYANKSRLYVDKESNKLQIMDYIKRIVFHVCLFVCLSIYLFIYLFVVCFGSVYLFVYFSLISSLACLFGCVLVCCLFVCLISFFFGGGGGGGGEIIHHRLLHAFAWPKYNHDEMILLII